LDRTAWQSNNILIASVIYQKRAFPIFWMFLSKKGASNFREQQIVLKPVIKLFKTQVRLILLITMAMTSAWIQGEKNNNMGQSSYVCRPPKSL
jgi:hypothetical protein